MAIITKKIGGFGSLINFEIDYDDSKLWLRAIRCINNSTQNTWGKAICTANGRTGEMIFPFGQTTQIDIPGNAAQGMGITITANGKIDGVDYWFMEISP